MSCAFLPPFSSFLCPSVAFSTFESVLNSCINHFLWYNFLSEGIPYNSKIDYFYIQLLISFDRQRYKSEKQWFFLNLIWYSKPLFLESCFIIFQVNKSYETLLDETKSHVLSSNKDIIPLKSELLLGNLMKNICFRLEYASLQKNDGWVYMFSNFYYGIYTSCISFQSRQVKPYIRIIGIGTV